MTTSPRPAISALLRHLPAVLLLITVLQQVTWALAWDRFDVSHRVVVLGAAAMMADAWRRQALPRSVIAAAGTVTLTWLIEVIGVRTGVPFGRYHYSDAVTYQRCPTGSLCSDTESVTHSVPALLGVPVIVPLAWLMMAYAAHRVGRHISSRPIAQWLWSSGALAAWDLILDPQFLLDPHLRGNGWWVWTNPSPHLPGIPGIPLSNFAGWLVAAAAVQALLAFALRPSGHSRNGHARTQRLWEVPVVFYAWTCVGAVFLGITELAAPAAAAWACRPAWWLAWPPR